MFVGCITEEVNLLSVPATPLAEHEVHSQPESLDHRQFSIEGLRLKAAYLLATWRKQGDRFGKGFHQDSEPFICSGFWSELAGNPYKHKDYLRVIQLADARRCAV
jgi:hypothetical protein